MKVLNLGLITIIFGRGIYVPFNKIPDEPAFHVNCRAEIQVKDEPKKVELFFCVNDGNRLKEVTITDGYAAESGEQITHREWHCNRCHKKLELNQYAISMYNRYIMVNISNKKSKK